MNKRYMRLILWEDSIIVNIEQNVAKHEFV